MGELPDVVKDVTRMSCEIKRVMIGPSEEDPDEPWKLECGVMTSPLRFEEARDDRWLVDEVMVSGDIRFAREDRDGEFEVAFEKHATCKVKHGKVRDRGVLVDRVTLDCE